MVLASVAVLERDGRKMHERLQRNYVFNMPLDTPSRDNTALWTALGTKGLSDVLDQGLQQVTDMIVHDFSATGRAEWAQKKTGTFTPLKGRRYEGYPVRSTEAWVWVRQKDSAGVKLSRKTTYDVPYAITGFQPMTGPIAAPATAAAPVSNSND